MSTFWGLFGSLPHFRKIVQKIKCECLQIVYSNNFIVKHIMGYSVQICMFLGVFRKEFYVYEINRSCR